MEPESGRRREKVFLSPLEHAALHEKDSFREHEGNWIVKSGEIKAKTNVM